ncbi:MAG: FliM/FliN family flagellar motor switch protein [Rhizomicrobium sp.]
MRINSELLRGLRISLEARLGEAKMTVEQLMALKQGSVVTLEASLADRVELFLNDALVARGEIVAVGDKFGVRIVEISQKP